MRKFKNIISFLVVFCAVIFSSCGEVNPKVDGDDLIYQARKDYAALDSAKVVMTNIDTDEVEQTFTFKYDEKDVLMFSYEGKSENSEYAQYNNGLENITYENGEYSYLQKGDDGFNLFTRDMTHAQADEGLILFVPKAVKKAEVTKDGNSTKIVHDYDVSEISATAENGEVVGFSVTYYFEADKLLYFTEDTKVDENGEQKNYDYKIEITQQNSVLKIENTVEKYKK